MNITQQFKWQTADLINMTHLSIHLQSRIHQSLFGSAARRGDIYLFLPVIIDLTPDNLDINSARGEYLRECPPAAHQLCMNYALCHMFYGLNRYFQ